MTTSSKTKTQRTTIPRKPSQVSQVIDKYNHSKPSKVTQLIKKFIRSKSTEIEAPAQPEIEIKIARSPALKEEAYRLIYQTYLEKGYTEKNATEMWYSTYDLLEDSTIIVAIDDHKIVGALTLIFDNEYGLPASELYENEIDQIRTNKALAEITSLGIKKDARFSSTILVKLFNQAYLYSKGIKNSSHFVITVNPRHAMFYTKKLLFDKIGSVKYYKKVGGAPAELLTLDLDLVEKTILDKNVSKSRTLYKQFMSVENFKSMQLNLDYC